MSKIDLVKQSKLIIEVSTNHDIMMDMFDQALTESKGVSKIMLRAMKGQYHMKSKAFYKLFHKRCEKYIVDETDDHFKAEEVGDDEYIKSQYNRLNNFLQSNESSLKNNPDYVKQKTDRKLWTAFKKLEVADIIDNLLKKALSGNKVNDLMYRFGIVIKYYILL